MEGALNDIHDGNYVCLLAPYHYLNSIDNDHVPLVEGRLLQNKVVNHKGLSDGLTYLTYFIQLRTWSQPSKIMIQVVKEQIILSVVIVCVCNDC